MATYRTILTDFGRTLEAAANVSGTPIVLTHMAVGDGNGNPVTPDPAQTILARERYRATLNRLFQDTADPTRFIAELVVPVDEGGFTIREIGLFTADGDLFAVANVPDAYKPTADEGAYSDTVIRMVFLLANASAVTLVIDPNVAVATQTWVTNNVNAATVIPGGLTNQVLSKVSNADGDYQWSDPGAAVEVIAYSREETQTLAASQTNVDLAVLNTEGVAVYIEGVRLRDDQFTTPTGTRVTLASSYPDGTKVTVVQNEEVGKTEVLFRANNLSDVPDKAAARANLDLPNWITTVSIAWAKLTGVPDYATRWPAWGEVTGKPTTFAPSAHTHAWSDITSGVPVYAQRWPTWTEVTSKPSTFTPSAHLHVIADVTGLQAALDAKANLSGATFTGTVTAPLFAQSSSRRYKRDIETISPRQALRLLSTIRFTEYAMRADGSRAMGVIAEELADGPLDFVVQRTAGGEPESVNYQPLFVLACAALQELAVEVACLKARIDG